MSNILIKEENNCLLLSNDTVEVIFDLQSGKYSAKRQSRTILEDAFVAVNEFTSCDAQMKYAWSEENISDSIGTGKMARIRCITHTGDEIILGIILYEGNDFISLRCGFKNGGNEPVQIKLIKPLDNGIVFRGFPEIKNAKLLDGNSGAFRTEVLSGGSIESRNNAMLTFGNHDEVNSLVTGGLTYCDFVKYAAINIYEEFGKVSVYAQDPYGRRVDGGLEYFPEKDTFYLDFCTQNPFSALEKYGQMLRISQKAEPNSYQFPSVCLWYAEFYDMLNNGCEKLNTSSGAVEEMRRIRNTGFLKYSPVAVRLVPDYYGEGHVGGNVQQGWWDDEHWQKYQGADEGNGKYTEPYETTKKWASAVQELGGIPLIYFQTSAVSEDYVTKYPEHTLFNSGKCGTGEWLNSSYRSDIGYDFTDNDFQAHMQEVYKNLKDGGIKGMMFDYPGTAWNTDGGFEDPYATTANNYVNVFKLAKEGLGKDSYIHERGCETGYDVALGYVDSQRTEDDTADMPPEMVSKIGLRWYKNRVVTNYDMDSKDLMRAQSKDELHTLVTMAYAVSGRLLIANSFDNLSEYTRFALSRTYPQHTAHKSFCPVDAFLGKEYPQIYDYAVNDDWHQVIFYNGDRLHTHIIETELSEDTFFGGLGLNKNDSYYVYDFWNNEYIGQFSGKDKLSQKIRKGESRMFSIRKALERPMVISTNRHIMQGVIDLKEEIWDNDTLSGISSVIADEDYRIEIKLPDEKAYKEPILTTEDDSVGCRLTLNPFENIVTLCLKAKENKNVSWSVKLIEKQTSSKKTAAKPEQIVSTWNSENYSLKLSWRCAENCEFFIYGNTDEEFTVNPLYLLGKTRETTFTDRDIPNHSCRYYKIVAVNEDGIHSKPISYKYEAEFINPIRFIGLDYDTKGDWRGIYASDGYSLRGIDGKDKLPPYITEITCNGNIRKNKKEVESCPIMPQGDTRHIGYECSTGILSYNVTVNDNEEHQVAFYCADNSVNKFVSEDKRRKMSLELKTTSGKIITDDIPIESFDKGVYIKLKYKGSFTLTLRNMVYIGLMDSVCAGIFFD